MNTPFTITSGTDLSGNQLSFQAFSVVIDNASNQWLFQPDSGRYIPPFTHNIGIALPGTQQATLRFQSPPGVVSQPVDTTQQVVATWYDVHIAGSTATSYSQPFTNALLGSFNTTGGVITTSPSYTLPTGTHAVWVIVQKTSGTVFPTKFQVIDGGAAGSNILWGTISPSSNSGQLAGGNNWIVPVSTVVSSSVQVLVTEAVGNTHTVFVMAVFENSYVWAQLQGSNAPVTDNLAQVGGANINLGQNTMANSLPVVVASDQSAVSENLTQVAGVNVATASATGVLPVSPPGYSNTKSAISAANAAVSLTYAATAGVAYHVGQVQGTFSATTTGYLSITQNPSGTVLWQGYVINALGASFPDGGIDAGVGNGLTITLTAGGVGITGVVSAVVDNRAA